MKHIFLFAAIAMFAPRNTDNGGSTPPEQTPEAPPAEETPAQKASRETKEALEKNGTAAVQASKAKDGQLTGFESSTGTGHRIE